MQIKATELENFLARLPPQYPIILVYGIDRGLISARVQKIIQQLQNNSNNAYSIEEIDANHLNKDPYKVLHSVDSFSMFSKKKLLKIINVANQQGLVEALTCLLKKIPDNCHILLEGSDLKKGTKLRNLIERSPQAMAIACYHDTPKDIIRLAHNISAQHGIKLEKEAAMLLGELLGADHMASVQEIEKLCLYVLPKKIITIKDIEAIIFTQERGTVDQIIQYFLLGNVEQLHKLFDNIAANPLPLSALYQLIIRQLEQLQLIRYQMQESRLPAANIIDNIKPPIFYKKKPILAEAVKFWNDALLCAAIDSYYQIRLKARKEPLIEKELCQQDLLKFSMHIHKLREKLLKLY